MQLHQQRHRLASSQAGRSRCRRYRSRGLTNILVVYGFQENSRRSRTDRFGIGVLVQGDAALRNVCLAIWGKAKCVVRKTGRQNLCSAMQAVGSRSDSQRGHWRQNLCSAMQGQPKCLLRNAGGRHYQSAEMHIHPAETRIHPADTSIHREEALTSTRRSRVCNQERRPSARRGSCGDARGMHRDQCPAHNDCGTKSGGRQPAVGSVETRLPCTANDVRTLTTAEPRAAGVSPPWCVNATAMAFVYGRPAGSPCATIVVLPLQARFRSHGWLTPAALHRVSGCRCRYGFSIRSSVSSPRLAYASRSWLYGVCSVRNAQFAMHSRTWNKSGGRQPAVDVVGRM